MVGAISSSWGKLFHIDTELGTKDDLKALVRACGIWTRGNDLFTWGKNTLRENKNNHA